MQCGYTCSADPKHAQVLDQRLMLATADREAWLGSFDQHGRYVDTQSGFWESLNGEFFSHQEQQWLPAYADEGE